MLRFLSSCIKLAMAGAVGTVTAVSISKVRRQGRLPPALIVLAKAESMHTALPLNGLENTRARLKNLE